MLARRFITNASIMGQASKNMRYGFGVAARSFSDEPLTIPTDREQQGGRRKEELDAEEKGGPWDIGYDFKSPWTVIVQLL